MDTALNFHAQTLAKALERMVGIPLSHDFGCRPGVCTCGCQERQQVRQEASDVLGEYHNFLSFQAEPGFMLTTVQAEQHLFALIQKLDMQEAGNFLGKMLGAQASRGRFSNEICLDFRNTKSLNASAEDFSSWALGQYRSETNATRFYVSDDECLLLIQGLYDHSSQSDKAQIIELMAGGHCQCEADGFRFSPTINYDARFGREMDQKIVPAIKMAGA